MPARLTLRSRFRTPPPLLPSLSFVAALVLASAPSLAAPPRTFVASTGNDANACTRTAPCRTFNAALAAVATGGEVLVLDTAGFGPFTVTKSVTISASSGVYGGITVSGPPGPADGASINAAPSDRVSIKGLIFNGLASSNTGLRVNSAGTVSVENCVFNGFNGVGISAVGNSELYVNDTAIRQCAGGGVSLSNGFGLLDRVRIEDSGTSESGAGVSVTNGARLLARDSSVTGSVRGFSCTGGSKLTLMSGVSTHNGTGIIADGEGSAVEVSRSKISYNVTGITESNSGTVTGDSASSVSNNNTNGTFTTVVASFVDLSTDQTIGGNKTFTQPVTVNSQLNSSSNSLELLAGGNRLYRLEDVFTFLFSPDNDPVSGPNLIGGSSSNVVTQGVTGASIAGGGSFGIDSVTQQIYANQITDAYGTVGGGLENLAGNGINDTQDASYATVSGGFGNRASSQFAAVSGGQGNTASNIASTVSGGQGNTASGQSSTVSGGNQNTASDLFATVGGGIQNTVNGSFSTVSGGNGNRASNQFATVGGGVSNTAGSQSSTVSGGNQNTASDLFATVSGGVTNTASGNSSTVGGGNSNTANAQSSTASGGGNNAASNSYATVSGGQSNTASGQSSTVSGGQGNTASGQFSFAAGHRAKAINQGSFVWGDSTNADVTSSVNDEFTVRASGGMRLFTNGSQQGLTLDGSGILHLTNPSGGIVFPDGSTQSVSVNPSNFVDLTTDQTVGGNKTFSQAVTVNVQVKSSADSLELLAGGNRLYRLDNVTTPGVTGFPSPNLIGGSASNIVTPGVVGAAIGGGGSDGTDPGPNHIFANRITDDYGTVGGGLENLAGNDVNNSQDAPYATVSGGFSNTASAQNATVSGGQSNTASGFEATVSGGNNNRATSFAATVSGGNNNTASGPSATVSGGNNNTASGDYSFAAGRQAKAVNQGAFVWGDSTNADVTSTANDEFTVRATGGIRLFTNGSLQGLTLDGSGILHFTNPTGGIVFQDGSTQTSGVNATNFVDLTSDQTIGGNKAFSQPVTVNGQVASSADTLDLAAGGSRLYRLENIITFISAPNTTDAVSGPNLIGGSGSNVVTSGVVGASIAGGGSAGIDSTTSHIYANQITDDFGTIGGGLENLAGNGVNDAQDASYATVGGGFHNTASGQNSVVTGGLTNSARGNVSTVSGGYLNTASGSASTVGGGDSNTASGDFSFAAGNLAQAAHTGSFVWSDSNNFATFSSADNEFTARATGGVRFISGIETETGDPTAGVQLAPGAGAWSSLSDRNMKNHFQSLDSQTILDKLANLPITEWSYKAQAPSIRHIGPMAQDFSAAFGLGEDDKHISTIDADGVMMSALQGLVQQGKEKDAQIARLVQKNAEMEARLARLERLQSLKLVPIKRMR